MSETGVAVTAPSKVVTATPAALSWRETRALLRQDRDRIEQLLFLRHGMPFHARLHPSYICVVLYRTARYFHLRGRTKAARFLTQLNTFVTGAEITPACDFGPGLFIVCPAGAALYGKAGRNFTVMPCAGMGGQMDRDGDVGAGVGWPVFGDDVTLEPHSAVGGPCRIGNRVRIGANTVVTRDVPDDTIVEGPPAQFRSRTPHS